MAYIKFDKTQLINLEYSLRRELLRSNRSGAFASTTIINCNTRKYHGLLIVPQPQFGNDPHVLLSTLDETVIQHDADFNLGIHKYQNGVYAPKGHKYVRNFELDPAPKITYRVGGVVLEKEILFSSHENQVLIKYTLAEANSPTKLRLKPFLAFRNIHELSKANIDANKKYEPVKNGIKVTMYDGYSPLFIQFSKKTEYVHVPDWYYNIEYTHESLRGYDSVEDLYVPGYFEIEIAKGESVILAAGTAEINPTGLKQRFVAEGKKRLPRNSFENCLINAAQQFVIRKENKVEVLAGYPWYGSIGRDTFMSLPGLLLTRDDTKTFKEVIDSMISTMQGPFFHNTIKNHTINYNSVDTQLWFFWALQKYVEKTGEKAKIWNEYRNVMKLILNAYRDGTQYNIKMQENGLLFAGETGNAITWMNALVNGKPVTPRIGLPVEVNALWYNAVMFSLELAKAAKDSTFTGQWKGIPEKIKTGFEAEFWDQEKGYLADYTNGNFKDWSVRPNQLLAVSMPYSPLSDIQQKRILDVVERELLTPKGLRSLTPKSLKYKGVYRGTEQERDEAYHQGSVVAWLIGHYAEAYLKVYKKGGLFVIKNLFNGLEPEMQTYGIGTISEIFDGDPPHHPSGAISMASSVAELLRIIEMIKNYE
ncbi:MAG: glycogen debranching enzyme family protein [Bacteroidales bacterium]|nr:glycogen debranching enzyme family protein [Bacteroidales bacterium]